jgi:uncharacterized membrane-anchored protein
LIGGDIMRARFLGDSMNITALALALVGLLGAAAEAHADQGAYPATDAELRAAFDALTWNVDAAVYDLPLSHAQIRLPAGSVLLLGADAERYAWLVNGIEYPATEAVMSAQAGSADIHYEWRGVGHVDDSDWGEVDPDHLLSQYNAGIDGEGAESGSATASLVGWLQRPTYVAASHTVIYAIELKEAEHHWANAVALRLGRNGYTEFTWAGSVESLQEKGGAAQLLQTALATHDFIPGYRYADFQDDDFEADDSLAGLLEARFRANQGVMTPAGMLGAIAVPILLVIGYVVHHLRMLFRRNSA